MDAELPAKATPSSPAPSSPPDPTPAPPRRRFDGYGAVVASLVGLLALLVSAYTAYLQRQQVRAQVWPRLELGWAPPRIIAANVGVGPARVTRVRVTVKGKPYQTWDEVLALIQAEERFGNSYLGARVLAPGQELGVLTFPDTEAGNAAYQRLRSKDFGFGMVACYCSVLDDCWVQALGQLPDLRPDQDQLVQECPVRAEDRWKQ